MSKNSARVDIFFNSQIFLYYFFLNQFLTENFPMWNWKNQGSDEKCYNMSQNWGNPTTFINIVILFSLVVICFSVPCYGVHIT